MTDLIKTYQTKHIVIIKYGIAIFCSYYLLAYFVFPLLNIHINTFIMALILTITVIPMIFSDINLCHHAIFIKSYSKKYNLSFNSGHFELIQKSGWSMLSLKPKPVIKYTPYGSKKVALLRKSCFIGWSLEPQEVKEIFEYIEHYKTTISTHT